VIEKVEIAEYHLPEGSGRPLEVARRVGEALQSAQVDISFVGIGENGHLAFNDPPADFQTEEPYLIVTLDEVCLRQQVGEGWFADISEVPLRAISMSVKQILKAKEIICVVPDARKVRRSSHASREKSARWRRLRSCGASLRPRFISTRNPPVCSVPRPSVRSQLLHDP
jgi:6-phosphogluconolactonase/glucosamine-6-phosphate isomerase/deaminase